MARRSNLLEFSVISLQTAGSILAVIGQTDWIVVTVALSSQCMAIIDYFYIPSQLAATNKALEDAHNLISWWDSLSLVQRKTRSCKRKCADAIENAVLNICNARTAVSSQLPSEQGAEEEEG